MPDILDAFAFYLVFVFSVTCHEAAHAWAAKAGGDLTAYQGGQVSLDPIPHMKREPLGMVVVPLVSVMMIGWPLGWASAPYDPTWAERFPRRAAWMALAGPAANVALVIASGIAIQIGIAMGAFMPPETLNFMSVVSEASPVWESPAAGGDAGSAMTMVGGIAFILSMLYSMNLLLAVLNMIPLPPLDGSGAMPLILPDAWHEPYRNVVHQPLFAWIGIILVWNLVGEIFWPVFHLSIGILYPGVTYG